MIRNMRMETAAKSTSRTSVVRHSPRQVRAFPMVTPMIALKSVLTMILRSSFVKIIYINFFQQLNPNAASIITAM